MAKQSRELKPRRPMNETEEIFCRHLSNCRLPLSCNARYFVMNAIPEFWKAGITEGQATLLARLILRFHRQIPQSVIDLAYQLVPKSEAQQTREERRAEFWRAREAEKNRPRAQEPLL